MLENKKVEEDYLVIRLNPKDLEADLEAVIGIVKESLEDLGIDYTLELRYKVIGKRIVL